MKRVISTVVTQKSASLNTRNKRDPTCKNCREKQVIQPKNDLKNASTLSKTSKEDREVKLHPKEMVNSSNMTH